MSSKTNFAGITRLEPGESLAEDNYAFQGVDRTTIDKLLRVGAQSHHHDAHAALANPSLDPVVAIVDTGGTIASDLSITVGYTLTDSDGGETALSSAAIVTTQDGLTAPETAPTLAGVYASGSLLAGNYAYSVTVTDGVGGETSIGSSSEITLDPGYASGRVTVTGLAAIATEGGGPGWRLWRSVNGGVLALIAVGTSTTVVDDGTLCPDASVSPPTTTGSTLATSKLRVTVPTGQSASAASFSIYATLDGSFLSPALLGTYPIASAGVMQEFTSYAPLAAAPPLVTRALAGADQINPDTDMVEFPWKRPVATFAALPATGNSTRDVRLAGTRLYAWNGSSWVTITPGTPEARIPVTASALGSAGFASAWQNEGTVAPVVSYWLDESGDLQLEGAASKTTAPVDGDVIFTLPTGHRSPRATYGTVGGDGTTARGFAAVDILANGNVVWKAGPDDPGAWVAFTSFKARL